jgi:hypothetical protein
MAAVADNATMEKKIEEAVAKIYYRNHRNVSYVHRPFQSLKQESTYFLN